MTNYSNPLYRRFNHLPYDLYADWKTKEDAKEFAFFARHFGKSARVVPDVYPGKWCVYVLGAKSLPPFRRRKGK
jgi:hypothetical protein